jgi:hypothetical protein
MLKKSQVNSWNDARRYGVLNCVASFIRGITIQYMGRKKNMTAQETKKPNRTGEQYNFYLPPEYGEALKTYLESMRPKPSITETFKIALEDFLQVRGFWPPRS